MAFGLNSVRRLFQQSEVDEKPVLGSDKQVYELFRQVHNRTGGPNEELRRLYVGYLRNTNGLRNIRVVGTHPHEEVPTTVRVRRERDRQVGCRKGLQAAQ